MPTPKSQKQKPDVAATLKKLEAKDPGLKKLLQKAYGYAVFPSVGKASLVVGGSYGRGEVFERGKRIGYATISQMTIGVQLGGTTFSEVIVFESKEALDRFKKGKTSPAAVASAVLVKAGAAANSDFEKGAAVFVYSEGGMELEAAIGGQRFKFKPADGQGASGKQQQQGKEESESGEEEDEQGAQASGEDEGEEEEDSEEGEGEEDQGEGSGGGAMELAGRAVGGLRSAASKAKAMVKRHPVAATMAGVGVAAGLGLLIARAFKGAGATDEQDEETDEQDEDQDEGAQDSAEEGDEDEAEDSDSDRAEGQQDEEDEEGGEDEDEGLSRRLMSRGRSRP